MKLIDYLLDHIISITLSIISIILIDIILVIFESALVIIIMISFIYLLTLITIITYDYLRRRTFYNEFKNALNNLERKSLVTEVIKEPNFLDGKILYNGLCEIDSGMNEIIKDNYVKNEEFKDYLELWCHEIKTPVATSYLIIDNNKNDVTKSIKEEVERIDYYIEQVLYYARMENANQDYHVNNVSLKEVIKEVMNKNKKMIIDKKLKINVNELDNVYSDQKWLLFIINQIINNAVKYSRNNGSIDISTIKNKNQIILTIKDTGIGINSHDLSKVFDKGFTGTNGRINNSSTGMGLYLVKKISDKLGLTINITSELDKETTVVIIFPNNSLIKEVY